MEYFGLCQVCKPLNLSVFDDNSSKIRLAGLLIWQIFIIKKTICRQK